MTTPIYVVGYPKSGNTWLSRLIGETLRCPVSGYDNALPLAVEGLNRESRYVVRQLHLSPVFDQKGVLTANRIYVDSWNKEMGKIIFIMRDPRDIAVAAKFYWDLDSVQKALHGMKNGVSPFAFQYCEFVQNWEKASRMIWDVGWTSFENLCYSGPDEIISLFTYLGLPSPTYNRALKAYKVQRIQAKREQIESEPGDLRPYGKTIQLKNLRKGIVGDWKNHFSEADAALAQEYFGDILLKYNYEIDEEWWKNDR